MSLETTAGKTQGSNDNCQISSYNKVSGRELHDFLEVNEKFTDWMKRMMEYGFTQGADFNMVKNYRVQAEVNREMCGLC